MADALAVSPRRATGPGSGSAARAHRLFISPTVLAVLVLGAYPLAFMIAAAVTESSLGRPFASFTGTRNFETVLADGDVVASLARTVGYALAVSVASTVLGVVVALALVNATRAGSLVRTLLLLPMIMPPVVVGTLWKLIFNPGGGLIDAILRGFGAEPASFAPLSSSLWALPAIGLADVWQWTPLVALLVYAALLTQDASVREAAALDGAHGFAFFRHITWPAIAGTVGAVLLIRLVIALKVFDLVFVMTSGGPGQSTTTTSYLIHQIALKEFDVGRASAVTLLFAVIVTAVTVPIVLLTRKAAHE